MIFEFLTYFMTDPIADMLTRIRNILRVRKTVVRIPFSNIKYQIAKILKSEGFVGSVERPDRDPRHFIVRVVYDDNQESPIRDLRRVSRPGQKVYATKDKIPYVANMHGVAIISTSSGLMTDREARKRKIGGELICEVW